MPGPDLSGREAQNSLPVFGAVAFGAMISTVGQRNFTVEIGILRSQPVRRVSFCQRIGGAFIVAPGNYRQTRQP